MVEHVGDQGEHGPPVARRTGVGAGLVDGVAVAEQVLEDGLGARVQVGPADLAQARHVSRLPTLQPAPPLRAAG